MPITLTDFFQHASVAGGQAQAPQNLYVRDDQLTNTSGVSKLRFMAKERENMGSVQAFLDAVRADPVYSNHAARAESIFSVRLAMGAPLSTKDIAWAKRDMDKDLKTASLHQNVNLGKELVKEGKLPQNTAIPFAQFCHLKEHALENLTDVEVPGLLKDFFKAQELPERVAKFCTDQGLHQQAPALSRLLMDTVVNDTLAAAMDGKQLEDLKFNNVLQEVKGKVLETLNVLQHESGVNLDALVKDPDSTQLMRTFVDAMKKESVLPKDLNTLHTAILMEQWPVQTEEDRNNAVRSFQMNTLGPEVMGTLLAAKELPVTLAGALGHHPDVLADARTRLDTAVQPPAMPSQAKAKEALKQAMDAFLQARHDDIKGFVLMAEKPPVDLAEFEKTGAEKEGELKAKRLSPDTLPKYINALLDEDKLLKTLLSDAPVDVNFLESVAHQARMVDSCTHGTKDAFNFLSIQKDAVKLLLAREGGPKLDQALMEKMIARCGPVASELLSGMRMLNSDKLPEPGSAAMQTVSRETYDVLQLHVTGLLELLPKDTLEKMGIPGNTIEERTNKLIATKLQDEKPQQELAEAFRAFADNHGVTMTPAMALSLKKDVLETVGKERKAVTNTVLREIFPPVNTANSQAIPPGFYTALTEVGNKLNLQAHGLDLQLISPHVQGNFTEKIVTDWLNTNPGPVTAQEMRQVVMQSFEKTLGELLPLADAVDAWPGPETQNGFSAAEKAAAKKMLMTSSLRSIDYVRETVLQARKYAQPLTDLMKPPIDLHKLGHGIVQMVKSMVSMNQYRLDHPNPESHEMVPHAIRMVLDSSVESKEHKQALFDMLNSDRAKLVSGAFSLAAVVIQPGVKLAVAANVATTMEKLHYQLGDNLGLKMVEAPMGFLDRVDISQIPTECMRHANSMVRDSFSQFEVSLSQSRPPLGADAWASLAGIANQLRTTVPAGLADTMDSITASNAPSLRAAQESAGDRPLTPAEIWKAITGKRAPRGLEVGTLGSTLHNFMRDSYTRALQTACPQIEPNRFEEHFSAALKSGVSFPKILALLKPRGALGMQDLTRNMDLQPLTDNDPIQKLVSEFPRRGANSTIRFDVHGGDSFTTRPFHIDTAVNRPDHAHYMHMKYMVSRMGQSETQQLRILQCLTEDALLNTKPYRELFPGNGTDEFGEVTAKQQEDGSVVVELRSTANARLRMFQQFVIQPDGTHACTAFTMTRNR